MARHGSWRHVYGDTRLAPGLDFGVFKSLGPFVDRVQRVQMELHEHVRHEGEIPCSVLDDFGFGGRAVVP